MRSGLAITALRSQRRRTHHPSCPRAQRPAGKGGCMTTRPPKVNVRRRQSPVGLCRI